MAKFTYFQQGSPGQVVTGWGEGHGTGKAWVRGAYFHPDVPDPLSVCVGDDGTEIWQLVRWINEYDHDMDRVMAAYGTVLKRVDIEAALRFYEEHKVVIDARIREELEQS
jgi:uncharacterized protein (DUF433 family)